jgi:hypothetical protein
MASASIMTLRAGSISVDVPRSVGYYGGVAAAVGLGLIEPPLAVFIAGVPLLKMLTNHGLPVAVRFVGEFFEGVAKPIGGDTDAVIELDDPVKEELQAREAADQVARGQRLADGDRPSRRSVARPQVH